MICKCDIQAQLCHLFLSFIRQTKMYYLERSVTLRLKGTFLAAFTFSGTPWSCSRIGSSSYSSSSPGPSSPSFSSFTGRSKTILCGRPSTASSNSLPNLTAVINCSEFLKKMIWSIWCIYCYGHTFLIFPFGKNILGLSSPLFSNEKGRMFFFMIHLQSLSLYKTLSTAPTRTTGYPEERHIWSCFHLFSSILLLQTLAEPQPATRGIPEILHYPWVFKWSLSFCIKIHSFCFWTFKILIMSC